MPPDRQVARALRPGSSRRSRRSRPVATRSALAARPRSRRRNSQRPGESGAAPGTRSSRARHRGPEAIPSHEFQRRPLEHSANLDPKLRTLHVCPSGALNVARIRWGKRIFQKAYPFRSRGPKMWGLRERDIVKLRRPVSPPVGGIMTRSPSIVRSMRRSG